MSILKNKYKELNDILLGVDLTFDETNLIARINSNALDYEYYMKCAEERLKNIQTLVETLKQKIIDRYDGKEKNERKN